MIHLITTPQGQITGLNFDLQNYQLDKGDLSDSVLRELQTLFDSFLSNYKHLSTPAKKQKASTVEEPFVAYTIDGKGLTKKEYQEHILAISKSITDGTAKTYTQEEIEKKYPIYEE